MRANEMQISLVIYNCSSCIRLESCEAEDPDVCCDDMRRFRLRTCRRAKRPKQKMQQPKQKPIQTNSKLVQSIRNKQNVRQGNRANLNGVSVKQQNGALNRPISQNMQKGGRLINKQNYLQGKANNALNTFRTNGQRNNPKGRVNAVQPKQAVNLVTRPRLPLQHQGARQVNIAKGRLGFVNNNFRKQAKQTRNAMNRSKLSHAETKRKSETKSHKRNHLKHTNVTSTKHKSLQNT